MAIAVGLLWLALMPATALWDADEGYYARTAAEMLRSGQWLLPTYNGEIFAHKPPLGYWLMATGLWLFGETEVGARLFSAPAMAGAGVLTFLIGRRLFNDRAGLWAMGVLTTSLLGSYLGFSAMLDAVLLFSVTLSIWAYVELTWQPGRTWLRALVFGVGLGLSLLVKGPVGPAVVITTVVTSWLLLPRSQRLTVGPCVALVVASLAAAAVFLGWAIPANEASGGQLLSEGVGIHVFGRALAPMEGHGGSGPLGYVLTLPAYVPFLALGFAPWIIQLPVAARAVAAGTIGDRRARVILWSWTIPTFVMFTLAATKLPHYIFPLYPALAIMVGAWIEQATDTPPLFTRWLRAGTLLYACGGLLLAAAVMLAPTVRPAHPSWPVAMVCGLGVLGCVSAVTRLHWRDRARSAARVLIVGNTISIAALVWLIVPPLEPTIKLAKPMAAVVAAASGPQAEVYLAGFNEPSFVFYLGRPHDRAVRPIGASPEGVAVALADPGEMVLIVPRPLVALTQQAAGTRPLTIRGEFAAYNLNRGGRFDDLVVLHRAALR